MADVARIRQNGFARFELVGWDNEVIANSYCPQDLIKFADNVGIEVISADDSILGVA